MTIKLSDALDVRDNPEHFDFFVEDTNHYQDRYKVEFYDEAGGLDGSLYLCGFEYGATHLICAYNESDAYSVWIDLLPTVPMDEIHEAYNAFDKLLEYMEAKGYENDIQLRRFCSEWCRYYFQVATKDANSTDAWDDWELGEGYEYQSNSTDSGIVNVGHYEWMRKIESSQISVARKAPVEAA
jgi:hypothetical protein